MVSALFFYQLLLVALVWLCVMLHGACQATPPLRVRHAPDRHGVWPACSCCTGRTTLCVLR